MSNLKIKDAPLLPTLLGSEKIPTGGRGNFTTSADQLKDYIAKDLQVNVDAEISRLDAVDASLDTRIDSTNLDISQNTGRITAVEVKVSTVAIGATANATNEQLRNRTTHTGVQPISSISNLQTELNNRSLVGHTHTQQQVTGLVTRLSGIENSVDQVEGSVEAESQARILFEGRRDNPHQVIAGQIPYSSPFAGAITRSQADKNAESVSVKDFGAIGDGTYHPLSERFATVGAAQIAYPNAGITALTQSIDWAAIQSACAVGGHVYAPQGVYVLTDEVVLTGSLLGDGVDAWDHLDPNPTLKKQEKGTHFLYYGAGAKKRTLAYTACGLYSGGVIVNPDQPNVSANDRLYQLFDFTNKDATATNPATSKPFSCGVYIPPYSFNASLSGVRLAPWFDGIESYKSSAYNGLAADWDVGLFVDNSAYAHIEDVQSVGYWRISGCLIAPTNNQDVLDEFGGASSAGRAYHTHIDRCMLQGYTGLMIRGGYVAKVIAQTSNSISIMHDVSNQFDRVGRVRTPKGWFNYTSYTVSGGLQTFNNVTPNPIDLNLGNGPVRIGTGVGLGGMSISRSVITGLDHSSMTIATDAAANNGRPSKAVEIDGLFRHIHFDKVYIQTREDVLLHVHSIDDLRFTNCQFEANGYKLESGVYAPTHGSRMICAPQDLANPIPTATGSTSINFVRTHMAPQVDLWPLLDRSASNKFASGTGVFNPRRIMHDDFQYADSDHLSFRALNNRALRLYAGKGNGVVEIYNAAGELVFATTPSGNLRLLAGKQLTFEGGAAFVNFPASSELYLRQGVAVRAQINLGGDFQPQVRSGAAPTTNDSLVFDKVSNTQIRVQFRGDDGVLRSATLNLS